MKHEIEKYNPNSAMFELKNITTIDQCVKSGTPNLAILKKDQGEDRVLAMLEIWIVDINSFFNLNNKMTSQQIKQTALMILQDFYFLNIADINLVFTRAKKGKFGELYGSLDGSKIYIWFEKYEIERSEQCYYNNLRQHDIERSKEDKAKMLVKNKIGKSERI